MSSSRILQWFGYIIFVYGAFTIVRYFITTLRGSLPPDMGIVTGDSAIALVGLVAISAASALREIERRVDQLERRPERSDQQ